MKKFKFTLQTVHHVREMRQEKEELVLSEINTEIAQAKSRLTEIEKTRLEAVENYTQKLKKGEPMNPFEMELNTKHIAALDGLIRHAKAAVEQKRLALTAQSHVVAAANQQVKITERLHGNQKKRYQAELDKHEQTEMDELVSANYARRMIVNK